MHTPRYYFAGTGDRREAERVCRGRSPLPAGGSLPAQYRTNEKGPVIAGPFDFSCVFSYQTMRVFTPLPLMYSFNCVMEYSP